MFQRPINSFYNSADLFFYCKVGRFAYNRNTTKHKQKTVHTVKQCFAQNIKVILERWRIAVSTWLSIFFWFP